MSGIAHQPQQPVEGENPQEQQEQEKNSQQVQDGLKERQEEYKGNLDEQDDLWGQFGMILTSAIGYGLLHASNRMQIVHAFNNLNFKHLDPNDPKQRLFIARLLPQITNPHEFQMVQRDLAIARKELDRQKKKGNKKGYADVGWGKFKTRMGYTALDRREQAFQIASAVQQQIYIEEKFIRAKQAFGLDDVHHQELKNGYASWSQKNKGKGIDEYIASSEARGIYRKQYQSQGKKLDKKTEKKGVDHIFNTDKKTRVQAIKNQSHAFIAGRQSIKNVLNRTKIYSEAEIQTEITNVINTPTPPPTQSTAPTQTTPPASLPSSTPKALKPNFFTNHFPKISNRFNAINNAFHNVGQAVTTRVVGALNKTFLKGIVNSALGQLVKRGIGAALGAATGGISIAASVGWEALKMIPIVGEIFKMMEGAVVGIIKAAAILIIAVPILLIVVSFFFLPQIFSSIVANNPLKIGLIRDEKYYSWGEFENNYLSKISNQTITWDQMEKSLFTQPDSYLSLDSDRHDQVKK